jgi:hypothetical protein
MMLHDPRTERCTPQLVSGLELGLNNDIQGLVHFCLEKNAYNYERNFGLKKLTPASRSLRFETIVQLIF